MLVKMKSWILWIKIHKFWKDYKQINVEYNLSNIHIKDIEVSKLDKNCQREAEKINNNLAHLREIEKYTLDF